MKLEFIDFYNVSFLTLTWVLLKASSALYRPGAGPSFFSSFVNLGFFSGSILVIWVLSLYRSYMQTWLGLIWTYKLDRVILSMRGSLRLEFCLIDETASLLISINRVLMIWKICLLLVIARDFLKFLPLQLFILARARSSLFFIFDDLSSNCESLLLQELTPITFNH